MQPYADYLMVVTPSDHIIKEISRYKRASVNVIGSFEGMHDTAHLVITHQTRCKPFYVQPAILKMAGRLSTLHPAELQINGFGYFSRGHTKTIYAVIENTDRTDKWFKLLTLQMGIKVRNFVPHIAIVNNIPVTSFNKLWPHFRDRPWSETFTVNSLTILHKDTYVDYSEWRVHRELFFVNRLKEMF